jgi:hypothetical protein
MERDSKTAKIVTRKIVQPDRDTKVINTTTRNNSGTCQTWTAQSQMEVHTDPKTGLPTFKLNRRGKSIRRF